MKSLAVKAFTLVEVIVVTLLIVVLSALLMPVAVRARLNSQRASCESNVRQIHLATLLYANDADDELPASLDAWVKAHIDWFPEYAPALPSFQDSVSGYRSSNQVFHCAADWGSDSERGAYVRPSLYAAVGSSYRSWNLVNGRPLSSVPYPSLATLVADASGEWHTGLHETTDTMKDMRRTLVHVDGHVSYGRRIYGLDDTDKD